MGGIDRSAGLVLAARAKINLGLEIIGKRRDGYHELRTLMQSVGLSDRLELVSDRGGRIALRCPGSKLSTDSGNIAFQAAERLRECSGDRRLGVRIVLRKRIPVGAGLGGGSADAAAVLLGLNRLWGLRLRLDELEDLAAGLGSDVPFCIRGGTQLSSGRGEILRPLHPFPALPVGLVYPTLFVPTSSIYGARRIPLTRSGPLTRLRDCGITTRSDVVSCVARLHNDLEPIVVRKYRRVGRLLDRLRGLGVEIARVSGSGSSLFVMTKERTALERALGEVADGETQVFRTWFRRRGCVSIVSRGAGRDIGAIQRRNRQLS